MTRQGNYSRKLTKEQEIALMREFRNNAKREKRLTIKAIINKLELPITPQGAGKKKREWGFR